MNFTFEKRFIKNYALFCFILFMMVSFAYAEEFNMNNMPPPKASIEYESGILNKGKKVFIDITIPENWHVNANVVADDFLKPSSIEIAAKGISFGTPIWPSPIKEYNEALDLENLVFKGQFQIIIPVDSIDESYDSLTTNATFHYQACDNSICLAPSKVNISIENSLESGFSTLKKNNTLNNLANLSAISNKNNSGIISLLFLALIGGLILNLMPCVLPILSLKLFSLIKQAGESRKRLMILGASTTAGILVSFWTLAAIISFIKFSGGNALWGMQFQSAGFIAFMVVISSAFAMSFFGVFEIWLPGNALTKMDNAGRKQGIAGAFFTGALLVLLSTPCSAPFLGTAMGFAFTQSAPTLFLFFTAAALGLALPYALVSLFPSVLKILPKPGIWMIYLQKAMGVLLFATVVWLLWIVNEQADTMGVLLFAVIAILSIICSFALGKFAHPGVPFIREVGVLFGCAIILFIMWFFALAPKYESIVLEKFNAKAKELKTEDGWYRYNPDLFEQFSKMNKTIFIDVTADWCLTCKANEAAVLSSKAFLNAVDSLDVILFKADWTRESPDVNQLLRDMGKSGVPAYAIYPNGEKAKQIVLPELLTVNSILEKLQ